MIWSYGGLVEASLPNALLGGNDTKVYFFIGWAILLSYVFFYWYRVKVEDPKHETPRRGGRAAADGRRRLTPARVR